MLSLGSELFLKPHPVAADRTVSRMRTVATNAVSAYVLEDCLDFRAYGNKDCYIMSAKSNLNLKSVYCSKQNLSCFVASTAQGLS